jgi:putative transposase
MKQSRFSEEQTIGILKEQERGAKAADVCREHGISQNTFYAWKSKYGGMNVSEAQRLRHLEAENAKFKRIVAEQALDIVALKDVASKKW